MFLVVFRNRKRADLDDAAYASDAAEMAAMARAQPGYRSFKSYTGDDGEVVAVSEWDDEGSARAWGRLAEHRAVQHKGRQDYYAAYTLFACADPRVHHFTGQQLRDKPMTIHLYGIPNCDTVRKARAWLGARGLEHLFHDFKREGADQDRLRGWVQAVGWERLLNRAGTTFRNLEPAQKEGLDAEKSIRLMAAKPSTIRRPVVETGDGLLVGFDEAEWTAKLGHGSASPA